MGVHALDRGQDVFTRSGSTWSELGGKLTGAEEIGTPDFGASVALSSSGATALIGGPDDKAPRGFLGEGAAWVFGSPTSTPTVTKLEPTTGRTGTSVTITGTNFSEASVVKFGSINATSFTVNLAFSITAVVPKGRGTIDVTVTTPGGTSPASPADQFTYSRK